MIERCQFDSAASLLFNSFRIDICNQRLGKAVILLALTLSRRKSIHTLDGRDKCLVFGFDESAAVIFRWLSEVECPVLLGARVVFESCHERRRQLLIALHR